ncbi:HEAT repeat domain-containing protein [Saccharothrix violaceirubra]|uniref:HEAT repeat protein n=1 Tax=Saccharothrix violaceirubra TaxID=413306 RepID=A0A7W7WZI3_9PSEU|nr:HEAT repeat domain-containing protein [Saccharothrix violaceirubra]MBB4969347.1 HEAT repeat protein [Saccharothrix violaceirubra]
MHNHSDIATGDALVARLVALEPTRAKRTEAYEALYRHARAVVVDQAGAVWLATMAAHPDHWVRTIAVRTLGSGRDPAAQPILVRALSDPDVSVVEAALEGLTPQSSDTVFDLLVTLLDKTDRSRLWVVRHAARRIAESSDPRRLDILADTLGDVHYGTEHDIAEALIRAGDPRVVPALIGHLHHRRPGRFAAAKVLGELRVVEATGPLVEVLRESDGTQALPVVEALGKLKALEAAPAIVPLLGHASPHVRECALSALNRIGGPLVASAALEATDDVHPDVRAQAVRVLARHGDHRAVGRLAAACDGPHVHAALTGLARLPDDSIVPTAERVLQTTDERRVRKLAGRILARAGRPPSLFGRHPDPVVRRAVVWVLGHHADSNRLWSLTNALKDEDEIVRSRAAAALGRITHEKTLPPLTEALRDPRPRVRANAATALGRTAPEGLRSLLADALVDPHPAVRSAASAALRATNRPL